ncbi:MAG TPA: MMPL family transporter, partial [Acidimicrobiales bacterium]|nr:MMPL family transporter [Acidimicrobiales bacterium]
SYDLLTEGFGAGFNGSMVVVVDLTAVDQPGATLAAVHDAVAADPGVAAVDPPLVNPAGDTGLVTVTPATAPQDAATDELVTRLRTDVLPPVMAGTGTDALVTGETAMLSDVSAKLTERLPWFIGAVVLVSFLLLVIVFRSILVPAKAAVMNLLSIGASYGVIVAVFQWGWGSSILGVHESIPVSPFVPMIMFAILFGLSMDYEVFLLSRIREQFLRHGDSHRSVIEGLSSTARVITSSALIMTSVFGAFMLSSELTLKTFGLGLTTAVIIDATLVRMVLVPATMSLLGSANWWVPGWLDRRLPHLDFEGSEPEPVVVAA